MQLRPKLTNLLLVLGVVAGCSQPWATDPVASWREKMPSLSRSKETKGSPAELESRAEQLERLGEYQSAEELYAEILRQDPKNEYIQQKLTAIQHLKRGQSVPQHLQRKRGEFYQPLVSSPATSPLPAVVPGEKLPRPPFQDEVVARRSQSTAKTRSIPLESLENPEQLPEWAGGKASPQPQPVAPTVASSVPTIVPRPKTSAPVYVLPSQRDPQVDVGSETPVRQVSQARNEEIGHDDRSAGPRLPVTIDWTRKSLRDLQQHLVDNPRDPAPLREMIQRQLTGTPEQRWVAGSTLDVLAGNSDARTLVIAELSEILVADDPRHREEAALTLGGLGSDARDALPMLRLRTRDRDPGVRQAAVMAIDAIER